MNNPEKAKLLKTIDEASFAMDDTRLFLDTHPDCSAAMQYFEKMRKIREKAMKEYTMKYGSLSSYGAQDTDEWMWNEGRLPWEGGNC